MGLEARTRGKLEEARERGVLEARDEQYSRELARELEQSELEARDENDERAYLLEKLGEIDRVREVCELSQLPGELDARAARDNALILGRIAGLERNFVQNPPRELTLEEERQRELFKPYTPDHNRATRDREEMYDQQNHDCAVYDQQNHDRAARDREEMYDQQRQFDARFAQARAPPPPNFAQQLDPGQQYSQPGHYSHSQELHYSQQPGHQYEQEVRSVQYGQYEQYQSGQGQAQNESRQYGQYQSGQGQAGLQLRDDQHGMQYGQSSMQYGQPGGRIYESGRRHHLHRHIPELFETFSATKIGVGHTTGRLAELRGSSSGAHHSIVAAVVLKLFAAILG
ncbi:hypothetical protein T492DRAFT_914566 [Pavlovales sp. CCMP2436]|nr:hypothetical protein T492DRAFT_914566 [Pavlovales sp. CCMP2436]